MQTANNAKFLRFWWEVSAQSTTVTPAREAAVEADSMVPVLQGRRFRRWYGNVDPS